MDPQLSAAAMTLFLLGAKIGVVGTIGFAIAWFRARERIKRLEAAAASQLGASADTRIERIEESVDYIVAQMERLTESQEAMQRALQRPPERP